MRKGKILSSAIVGTSAMTLFSYLVSNAKNKNFREPEVLEQLVQRLPTDTSKRISQVVGWSLHYAVGLLFVVCYHQLWKHKKIQPSLASGALLGAASGVVGIIGWDSTLTMHPNPPKKNRNRFFGHLLLAHIVFGVFSALTYKSIAEEKS